MWARIGYGSAHRYSWKEVEPDGKGGWRDMPGGKSGTPQKLPALESGQDTRVSSGAIVKLHEIAGGAELFFWYAGEGVSWG